jgi:phosphatidylinositol alpha-mannosyltransferase
VCGDGRYGRLFRTGDAADLARAVLAALDDDRRLRAREAASTVWRYDWSVVTAQVIRVYETVVAGPRAREER